MHPLTAYLTALLSEARTRLDQARAEPERGDIPDNIVVISLLVLLAIAVIAVITAKVMARANSISI